jgi:hypothetical protein
VKFVKEECLSKLFLFGERPYAVLCKRIVRIITPSATTKERVISCYLCRLWRLPARTECNVAKGSVGSCTTITERQHEGGR